MCFFAGWRITERDYFQVFLLGILSGMEPTIYFQICCDSHFPIFGKYIFPQLQTYVVIFNNFLVFNFPFFNFEQ